MGAAGAITCGVNRLPPLGSMPFSPGVGDAGVLDEVEMAVVDVPGAGA